LRTRAAWLRNATRPITWHPAIDSPGIHAGRLCRMELISKPTYLVYGHTRHHGKGIDMTRLLTFVSLKQ
jgi:hypothetical protein